MCLGLNFLIRSGIRATLTFATWIFRFWSWIVEWSSLLAYHFLVFPLLSTASTTSLFLTPLIQWKIWFEFCLMPPLVYWWNFYLQHIMPPYGTPPDPYVAMYPYGGIYAYPSMPSIISFIMLSWNYHIVIKSLFHQQLLVHCLKFIQGSYPFSPFAMPSPNGIAEALVSISSFIIFLCSVSLLC